MRHIVWCLYDSFLSHDEVSLLTGLSKKEIHTLGQLLDWDSELYSTCGMPIVEGRAFAFWEVAALHVWRELVTTCEPTKRLQFVNNFLDELSYSLPEDSLPLQQLREADIGALFADLSSEIANEVSPSKWIDVESFSEDLLSAFLTIDNIVQLDRSPLLFGIPSTLHATASDEIQKDQA